jgi:hypothetical protein
MVLQSHRFKRGNDLSCDRTDTLVVETKGDRPQSAMPGIPNRRIKAIGATSLAA